MASADTKNRRILRPSSRQTVSRRRVYALRARFRGASKPFKARGDGYQDFARYRQCALSTAPLFSLSFCSLIAFGAPADPAQHLEFLTDLLSRITQDKSPDAHVLVLSTLAHAKLLFGDLEGSKTDIDAAWKVLDNLDAVDNSVNGAYYQVAADYYKVRFVGVKASARDPQYRFLFS